jgi:hypothetical protein
MGGGRVLETGVFTWLNFPPAALDHCRHPCVWLQDAESLHEVDAAVHYCGETSPRPAVMDSEAASVYLCERQVLPFDNEESFDVTMTQYTHSHLPLRYVPPPAVWLAAFARRPRPLLPGTGQQAAVALFVDSSSISTRWNHCAPSGAS